MVWSGKTFQRYFSCQKPSLCHHTWLASGMCMEEIHVFYLLQIVGSLEISKPRSFTLFQRIVLRCPRKISTTVSRNILTHSVVSSLRKGFLGTLSFWGIPQNAPNPQALAAAAGCFQSTNHHGSQHLVLVWTPLAIQESCCTWLAKFHGGLALCRCDTWNSVKESWAAQGSKVVAFPTIPWSLGHVPLFHPCSRSLMLHVF